MRCQGRPSTSASSCARRQTPACRRRPWARRTCPGSAAARPATRRCRRARAPSCGWRAGWRTGRRGAGAPRRRRCTTRASAASVPERMSSGSIASHTASTRITAAARASRPRKSAAADGRPGDRHRRCAAAQFDANVRRRCASRRRQCHGNERGNRQWRSACEAAPLVHDVGVDPVRHRHARHRRSGLRAFAQNLRLELGAMTTPHDLLGVFHGVHLTSLVDTILTA